MGLSSLGFGQSSTSQTGRQGTETFFPKQFALDLNSALGGPLTINDLFKLSPQPHSLFGYGPQQGNQPTGSFSLGFGTPTSPGANSSFPSPGSMGQGPVVPPSAPAPTQPPAASPNVPGMVPEVPQTPPGTAANPNSPVNGSKTYTLSDLTNSYFTDPDKVMDLPRLFRQAGLSGDGFTYDQIAQAVNNAKNYGFSGRSQKNFANMLANLQRDSKIDTQIGGKTGSGIF